jgi:methylamine dehydrogenase accessory protein MauD
MVNGWMIAAIAQWVVLLCLALVVLAHSRLLGLLHLRLGPSGARPLADGPELGAELKELAGRFPDGSPWSVRFPTQAEMILIFISPQCQTCNALIPHVEDFLRVRPSASLTLVSTIDNAPMNSAYIAYRRMEKLPYVLGEELARGLDIEGTPYALRIGEGGRVLGKGIVNSFENLMTLHNGRSTPMPAGASVERSALNPNERYNALKREIT